MGLGKRFKNWALGSIAGKIAKDGGPLKGLGEAAARKLEDDADTPGFVSDRLKAERYGRNIGRGIDSARKEIDD